MNQFDETILMIARIQHILHGHHIGTADLLGLFNVLLELDHGAPRHVLILIVHQLHILIEEVIHSLLIENGCAH